jgi:hypothetical protein
VSGGSLDSPCAGRPRCRWAGDQAQKRPPFLQSGLFLRDPGPACGGLGGPRGLRTGTYRLLQISLRPFLQSWESHFAHSREKAASLRPMSGAGPHRKVWKFSLPSH